MLEKKFGIRRCFVVQTRRWMLAIGLLIFSSSQVFSQTEFRSIDGLNNNRANPRWGAAGVNLIRKTRNGYDDRFNEPARPEGPSPRLVSNSIAIDAGETLEPNGMTDMVWAWWQFIDNDIHLTLANGASFPIEVPTGDPFFDPESTGREIIQFQRANFNPRTGNTNRRQQVNSVSAWLDGSTIYGSDSITARDVRTLSQGLLKTSFEDLLPVNSQNRYFSGDVRATQQVALNALHTLFVREHNRIATKLGRQNRNLNDEQIFQRARQEVIGLIQHITYDEFLPAILGDSNLGFYRGYRNVVNPGITNAYSATANRISQSMVGPVLTRRDNDGETIPAGDLPLAMAFENDEAIEEFGIDVYLKGLTSNRAQAIDIKMTNGLRNILFGPPGSGGLDLFSVNVQRGRDQGLPDFNSIRRKFGMGNLRSFAEYHSDLQLQMELFDLYGSVNKVDPYVGMLAEEPSAGDRLGATAILMIREQFQRLRDADRFWYEVSLPSAVVTRISRTRLGNVIFRNTNVRNMPLNVFFAEEFQPDDDNGDN